MPTEAASSLGKSTKLEKVDGGKLPAWREEALLEAIAAGVPPAELDWLRQELAGLDGLSRRLESFKYLPEIRGLDFGKLRQLWRQGLEARTPVKYLTGVAHWRYFFPGGFPRCVYSRTGDGVLDRFGDRLCEVQKGYGIGRLGGVGYW